MDSSDQKSMERNTQQKQINCTRHSVGASGKLVNQQNTLYRMAERDRGDRSAFYRILLLPLLHVALTT
jgi:hypothetical protein